MAVFSTSGLARSSARHPWRVIGVWIVVLVIAAGLASTLGNALTTTGNFTGKPDSQKGEKLIERSLRPKQPVTETIIVKSDALTVDDQAFKDAVNGVAADVKKLDSYLTLGPTYYEAAQTDPAAAKGMVSADKHATIMIATFKQELSDAEKHADEYLKAISNHN